jgi:2-dehydropantoate 2-reductase
MKNIRIGIIGIGGTGGFFGGKLAQFYQANDVVDVVFIARGNTKEAIRRNGLYVESDDGNFRIMPGIITDEPAAIGQLDVLLVCVKSYSIEETLKKYGNNVKKGGVVITIQNIVNQAERASKLLPDGVQLLEGCVYIISNIVTPGRIKHRGGPATMFFGASSEMEEFKWVEEIFTSAGIKATLSDKISKVVWKKFLLISPLAVATSYFSCTIGELRNDPVKFTFFKGLMEELFRVIEAKRVGLERKEIQNHLRALEGFPGNGKTSLQLDLENNKPSEIDSLLEYVCDEAKRHGIPVANYTLAVEKLTVN